MYVRGDTAPSLTVHDNDVLVGFNNKSLPRWTSKNEKNQYNRALYHLLIYSPRPINLTYRHGALGYLHAPGPYDQCLSMEDLAQISKELEQKAIVSMNIFN